MRTSLQPAFVLHSRPFRDTSLLLDLLTQHHGRIHAIARSARGGRSRFRGVLQPFVPFLASWSGKTELQSISQIEANGLPYQLSGMELVSGFYLNELLVRLLPREDAHPSIYNNYQNALIGLQQRQSTECTLRLFEKKLLIELGYAPSFNKDVNNSPILTDQFYHFYPDRGFIKVIPRSPEQILFRGNQLLALHYDKLQTTEELQAAKKLLRMLLAPLLGDKPIRSRELLLQREDIKIYGEVAFKKLVDAEDINE